MTDPTPATPEQPNPAAGERPTVPAQRVESATTEPQATAASDQAQAHDPWSREAETVTVAAGDPAAAYPASTIAFETGSDVVTGPEGVAAFDSATPAKRRRRTPIVLAIAAVLVVLLGAGAYAGMRYYSGAGIVEPESAVPASATAFARIDLSPGLRDKLSFNDLVKKFPTNGKSTEDLVTKVETKIATSAGLNYDTDVKPWFGGQAGVAEWTNASGDPVLLLVFSSNNDASAKAALAKVQAKVGSSFGFVLRGGYALVAGASSGAQADATAAAAEAASHNLANSATYKSALTHVSGHNLVIAYVDLNKIGALVTKEMGNISSLAAGALGGGDTGLPTGALSVLPGITGGDGTNPFAKLTGTVIVGGAVVSDGVEIRAHVQGLPSSLGTSTNVRPTMDAMPDTTAAGFALDGIDPNSATGKQLSQLISGLTGMSGDASGGGSAMLSALAGPITSVVTSKVISLSLTGVANALPSGFLAVDARDAASAQSIMSAINGLTGGQQSIPGLTISQHGTHVQATMGGPTSTGKLGGTSLYTETTAGMSDQSSMGYIDVTKLVAMLASNGASIPANVASDLAPVKAIGIGSRVSGTSEDELVRIIIK